MSDKHAQVLCDSISECQAVLHDHEGGTLSEVEALKRIRAEIGREGLLRAMHDVGSFPPDTPPPVVLADN